MPQSGAEHHQLPGLLVGLVIGSPVAAVLDRSAIDDPAELGQDAHGDRLGDPRGGVGTRAPAASSTDTHHRGWCPVTSVQPSA